MKKNQIDSLSLYVSFMCCPSYDVCVEKSAKEKKLVSGQAFCLNQLKQLRVTMLCSDPVSEYLKELGEWFVTKVRGT